MKLTMVRLALGLCLLVLVSASAWAIPPYCDEVCEFRQASYHCSWPPFGTITCGEFCTSYCPGSCGVSLTEDPSFEATSWLGTELSEATPLADPEVTLKQEGLATEATR